MVLLKDGEYADDIWTQVDDNDPLTDKASVVSLTRWKSETETLRARNAPLGLRLEAGESPDAIADDIDNFEVIMLNFPAFKDGRAYSYARLLRQRYGFTGELRATGDVLRSQLQFMHRMGFDTFDVDTRITPEVYANEVARISNVYQPSVVAQDTVIEKRSKR
jgi:uncharacterized protein (DUF934 family)